MQPPYQKRLPPQLPASPSSVKLGDRAVLDQLAEVHAKVIQGMYIKCKMTIYILLGTTNFVT